MFDYVLNRITFKRQEMWKNQNIILFEKLLHKDKVYITKKFSVGSSDQFNLVQTKLKILKFSLKGSKTFYFFYIPL